MGAKRHPIGRVSPILRPIFERQDAIGMTGAELAARSGIDRFTISAIRNRRQRATTDQAEWLAEALGLEVVIQPKPRRVSD